jgi:hypothetical protein
MYNTKLPEWDVLTATKKDMKFNGQLAYAYCKRGQVLLAERLTAAAGDSRIQYVSCHPGWVDTPGVDAAYGSSKKYLEPLRTIWQGTEGIAWLCAAPSAKIQVCAAVACRVPVCGTERERRDRVCLFSWGFTPREMFTPHIHQFRHLRPTARTHARAHTHRAA